jgi:hypothetical protein
MCGIVPRKKSTDKLTYRAAGAAAAGQQKEKNWIETRFQLEVWKFQKR